MGGAGQGTGGVAGEGGQDRGRGRSGEGGAGQEGGFILVKGESKTVPVYFSFESLLTRAVDPDPGGENFRKILKKRKEIGRNC